ncbi:hypothetical protein [Methanobacterium sp.]|uniref:hypothetical protein n=1 Tax=Methanobacterium sp. TaxID=2164 RepID=UPI003C7486E9
MNQLAALLHDIADWKFHDGNKNIGPKIARNGLRILHVDKDIISHIYTLKANKHFMFSVSN